jgi:threonylcarbamoyladenosine tRNA methylthiotransferase MtaB
MLPQYLIMSYPAATKTIKFITLGCKVNQYDTQLMRESLLAAGFKETQAKDASADVYVVNTCTVTHKADRDSLYSIHRSLRRNPKARLVVTGCLAELDKQLLKQQPGSALIVSNRDKAKVVSLMRKRFPGLFRRGPARSGGLNKGITFFQGHTRAFLKVQDGCNNRCSYCKVPLVRGVSRSQPVSLVRKQAEALARNGFKEVVLTGICLGSYGKDLARKADLVDLINAIEDIPGLARIRLSSIEAGDVSARLIRKIASSGKLCNHLHIPIQSGDARILKKMNRRYSPEDYLKLIRRIKASIPDIAITTDVLVGFPGEKEENFQNTLDLIKDILPLRLHVFAYSPREHTRACDMPQAAAAEVVKERCLRLKAAGQKCGQAYQRHFLSRRMDVLVEDRPAEGNSLWEGHTSNYIKVLFKSPLDLKNRLIPVKLTGNSADTMSAVLARQTA